MIDSQWQKPYQTCILQPLLKSKIANMSPALLTLLACFFGIATLLFLRMQWAYFAFATLVLSGLCDTLDGAVARVQKTDSPKGAALDITSDRLVEFMVILGLYLYAPDTRALGALWMLGASFLCVTTFLVVGIFEKNASEKSFHYSPGLIERAEAFLFFGAMILCPYCFQTLAFTYSALVFLTAGLRLYQFSRML